MKSPVTGKEMKILKEKRKMSFRKEDYEIIFHSYHCADSDEKFESDEFSMINQIQVLNKYREKHNLPFPDEIKLIRDKYQLSAAKMSEILGLGINTYRNYEHGEVPATSNARLIQMANNPREFKSLVDLAGILPRNELEQLKKRLETIIEESEKLSLNIGEIMLDTGRPNEFNGYKSINHQKLYNIILFFAEKITPWKTKLNKLLFYSDFLHFKKNCSSITGLNYRAIPLGPVPDKFDIIFSLVNQNKFIEIEYKVFPNEGTGERFYPSPERHFNEEIFNTEELTTLNQVMNKVGKMNTYELVEMSHNEKGWIENQEEKGLISYFYGFDLAVI
jgi:DNA-binding transcriptional regulator YiaG/uncharacterized phage-associated protein